MGAAKIRFFSSYTDIDITPALLQLPGFTDSPNVVGTDASVDTGTLQGAFAAVTGAGAVSAGQITAPAELGAISTGLAEMQAVRAALELFPDGAKVQLICDHEEVQKLIRQAQQRSIRPKIRRQFQALHVVDDVICHVHRLDVHVTNDSSSSNRKIVGQTPTTVAAHKIAYALLRAQRDGVRMDEDAIRWLESFAARTTRRKASISYGYDRWQETCPRRKKRKSPQANRRQRQRRALQLACWEDEGGAIV